MYFSSSPRSAVRALFDRWVAAREKRGGAARAADPHRLWKRVSDSIRPTIAAMSVAAGGSLAIQIHAQTVTSIVANGRTATTVTPPVTGTTTNVTTTSIQGTKAFNAFTSFKIGQTDTVNLLLPDGTTHLINLVFGSAIQIDGTLNSILSNKIGGHIVFADPFGMIVGSTGVLNVGGLTAMAPTAAFMDGVISAGGVLSGSEADKILNGTAARAPGALIRIDGRINSLTNVALYADLVQVNGTIQAGADARHQDTFVAAVNAQGLSAATGFVDQGGVIEIVGNSLTVTGVLDVTGKTGGSVKMQGATLAVGNTDTEGTLIDASGREGGGSVNIGWVTGSKAGTVTIGGEVTLRADATTLGAGGTIDVWGTTSNQFAGVASVTGKTTGGTIRLGGDSIVLSSSLDASGQTGGGSVQVGWSGTDKANSVVVTQAAILNADATVSGNGGTVDIWGTTKNQYYGSTTARGGSVSGTGSGGTVRISGQTGQVFGGAVDTTAKLGAAGSLSIDQFETCIVNLTTDSNCYSTILWSSLNSVGGTVNVTTSDRLRFGGAKSGTLTSVNADFTQQKAGSTANFTGGSIVFNANSALRTKGADVKLYATGGSIDLGNGTIATNGGTLFLSATDAMSMSSGALINTRNGVGDAVAATSTAASGASGAVTIQAASINLGSGTGIYAQAGGNTSSSPGGAVNLIAYERAVPLWNPVAGVLDVNKATAQVDISGTVRGGSILVGATAISTAGVTSTATTGFDENGNPVSVANWRRWPSA